MSEHFLKSAPKLIHFLEKRADLTGFQICIFNFQVILVHFYIIFPNGFLVDLFFQVIFEI